MLTLVYKGEPHVVINLSEDASNAALDALASMMDGGEIELLSTDDDLIARLALSNPVAEPAHGGTMEFNAIRSSVAVAGGEAATARIVGATGAEVFLCDVGDMSSDAVVKLDKTRIDVGQAVRIHSFVLSMP